uniref:CSON002532 protein n=1 Tax=Culicoides sonorensis TaxID=179676 RepID=A0A336LS77_CULSO
MIKQGILNELQKFVSGVSTLHRGLPVHSQLLKCSLTLLAELPAARNIVFEYFSLVFDNSVANYMIAIEKDPQASPTDDSISEIQDALENLVTNSTAAWSPLISNWSLRLLGQLSDKHSRRRTMDIGTACTLWLGSSAMRCLLGLTALCFDKLTSNETEACISNLLATFVNHSPHMDWVVARLGGCFPLKVISKILQCGLKGFSGNYNSTLDSEVGILGYLSCSHEKELKYALTEMIEAVKQPTNVLANHTIPYILHLAEMSEILLQSIVDVFLEIFNESFIDLIKHQYRQWPSSYSAMNVLQIISGLILKSGNNSTKILMILAKMAPEYMWCNELLELVLVELEGKTLEDVPCQIMKDLMKQKTELWQQCSSDSPFVQQTALWVLLLNSFRSSIIYHQTICELLSSSTNDLNKTAMNSLIRFIGGVYGLDIPDTKPGLALALERITLQKNQSNVSYNILRNLVFMVRLEKNEISEHLKRKAMTTATIESMSKILSIWEALLNTINPELEVDLSNQNHLSKKIKTEEMDQGEIDENEAENCHNEIHLIAELLEILEVSGKESSLSMTNTLRLSQLTVKYLFWTLTEKDVNLRDKAIDRSYNLLSKQCMGQKAAQAMALRELLEGALFTYGNLFGSVTEQEPEKEKKPESLLKLNQQQGIAMIASRSLVLHAGVIGNGPKLPLREAQGPQHDIKNIFLNAIEACCSNTDLVLKIDGYNYAALLLVEYLSTDVMYNGLPWPEEEFTKVTMERDLQIRRSFKEKPILWSIMGLIASVRPSICLCSVLLRALCASVLHQWRAKSVENVINTKNDDLIFVTVELLKLLSLSQMLPPPLDYLYIVVQKLDPNEIAYVLKECVWNFMREYVPSPILFGCDTAGLHWRDPLVARPPPQFIDPLRHTMQKNIKKFGTLYYQMFCIQDLGNEGH